jgi:hypothetical protein
MESTPVSIFADVVPIRIRDEVPMRLWLATGAGMMERAAYYSSIIMTRRWKLMSKKS